MTVRILTSIDLTVDGGSIVLYDWTSLGSGYSARNIENLVRLDADGKTVWSAKLSQTGPKDFFTDMRFEGDVLVAHTWSGYLASIDVSTGDVTVHKFTK